MWERILALLQFFLPSFLLNGSHDDNSSTFEDKRETLNFRDRSDDFLDFPKSSKRFRKHKQPDVYNGENVEWPHYLCHFEQVSH